MKTFETIDRNEVMNFLSNLLEITNEEIEEIQEKYSYLDNKDEYIETNRYDMNKNRIYRVDELTVENIIVNRAFQKIKGFSSRSDTKEFFQTIIKN